MAVYSFYKNVSYVNGVPIDKRKFMDEAELSFYFDALDRNPVWGGLLRYIPTKKDRAVTEV